MCDRINSVKVCGGFCFFIGIFCIFLRCLQRTCINGFKERRRGQEEKAKEVK